jgi:hypothetical protein
MSDKMHRATKCMRCSGEITIGARRFHFYRSKGLGFAIWKGRVPWACRDRHQVLSGRSAFRTVARYRIHHRSYHLPRHLLG